MKWKKLFKFLLWVGAIVLVFLFFRGVNRELKAATPDEREVAIQRIHRNPAVGAVIDVHVVLDGSPSVNASFVSRIKTDGPIFCATTKSTKATTACEIRLRTNYHEGDEVTIETTRTFAFALSSNRKCKTKTFTVSRSNPIKPFAFECEGIKGIVNVQVGEAFTR